MILRRCIVSGRVQGVFYRKSAQRRATELGLRGHARNLADGRVEVLVLGEAAAVDEFCGWLWEGPSAARVTGVAIEELEVAAAAQLPEGFSTG